MKQMVSAERSKSQAEGLFVHGRIMERGSSIGSLEVRVQMAIGAIHSLEAKENNFAIIARKPLIIYLSVIS